VRRWVSGFALLLVVGGLGSGAGAVAAQDASPVASPAGPPTGCTVVADGLINPRNVAVADDGTLYISEAGTGGDEALNLPQQGAASPDAGSTPEADAEAAGPPPTRGLTGQVTMIAPDGTKTVVAKGLPSYNFEGPVGPSGIVLADGKIWLAIGGAGPATAVVDPLENENSVVQIDPGTGAVTKVADLGAEEKANNPDPNAIDSDLYGMALGPDGKLYVADAGGNDLYTVDPASGDIALVATIPGLPLPAGMTPPPGGNPSRGGANELDPVPIGVDVGPDGTVYLGLLSGGPFPPGAAKVVTVSADGQIADAATGLTMVVGVAVGPDGGLYASELSTNFGSQPPGAGNVVRVGPDGETQVSIDGLPFPNGIAFDKDGNLYIVTGTVSFGPPSGQVLRCLGVALPAEAPPAASPVASPAATPVALIPED